MFIRPIPVSKRLLLGPGLREGEGGLEQVDIFTLRKAESEGRLRIEGELTEQEYAELNGRLQGLRVFCADQISEPASVIKTGARHTYAKYLLFPVSLRRAWRADEYDFNRLRCGVLPSKETLYVIYAVPAKSSPQ